MASGKVMLKSTKHWEGYVQWNSTPNPETNSSNIEANCYVYRTDGGESFGNNPYTGRVWVGAKQASFTFKRINGEVKYAGSCWATVPHDSDGNAEVQIGARIKGSDNNDLTGSTLEGQETVTLDHIILAGPSKISVNTDSQQMGKKVLISIEPDHPECIHELRYRFGSREEILGKKIKNGYEWTVPDLADQCTLEGTCRILCRTFFRKKNLGTTEAKLTLRVPDPSKPELSQGILGAETKIHCPRKSQNFESRLSFILSGQEYAVGEGKEEDFFWTPSYTLAKVLPAEPELKGVLRCRTFNAGVEVGTEDSPVILTVPENEHTRPRIEGLTLSPYGPDSLTQYGWLRGKTGLRADFQPVSDCSEIESCEIRAGILTAEGNPAILTILEDAGLLKVVAAVRDSRGFTASLTREIQVIPYEKPRLTPGPGESKPLCCRADQNGTLSPAGTCLLIRAGILFTDLDGRNKGVLSLRIRRGEEPFGDFQDLSLGPDGSMDGILPGIQLSRKHSYEAELRVRDSLNEETVTKFSILSQAVSFSLYDGVDGAAFGKYPETPHVVDLAEHMTLLVRGRLELRGETWMDLGLAPGIRPAAQVHGQVDGAKYRLSGGNHVILAFSCRMPPEGQAINQDPVPQNLCPRFTKMAVCPSEGGAVMVSLEPDGFLRAEPLVGNRDPGWIDGTLEYFK